MTEIFGKIWAKFLTILMVTSVTFLVWLIMIVLTIVLFSFFLDRHMAMLDKMSREGCEWRLCKRLLLVLTVVTVVCLVVVLVLAGWVAAFAELVGMSATMVILFHMVD